MKRGVRLLGGWLIVAIGLITFLAVGAVIVAVAPRLAAQQPTLLEPEQLRFAPGTLPASPSEVTLWASIGANLPLVRVQVGPDFDFQMAGGVPQLRVKFPAPPPPPAAPAGVYHLRGARQGDGSYLFPSAPGAGLTALIYRNGQLQSEGDDYLRDAANPARIVPATPWSAASRVIAHYLP